MTKTILITGAAGFISRYVGRHFSELGYSVIGIDSSEPENAPLASLTNYYKLRLPNPLLNEILQQHQPDVCIHCAGLSNYSNASENNLSSFVPMGLKKEQQYCQKKSMLYVAIDMN